MDKPRVLFLCTGNSCRSQMAEGWLRHLAGERFTVLSAGTRPGGVNPRAIAAMAEVGIDVSGHTSDDVAGYLDDPPELVISVCDHAAANCPVLPGSTGFLRWSFRDPADATGSEEEIAAFFGGIRDEIGDAIRGWLAEGAPPLG